MKVEVTTIIRTVILAIAFINQLLTVTGHSIIPVSDDQVATLISSAFTIGVSIWTWWKNNSFTQAAMTADELMREIKAGKK